MSVPTVSNRSTNRNANTITANSTVLFSMKLKSNLNAVSPSAAKSVSYTHLDVYKRQDLHHTARRAVVHEQLTAKRYEAR